MNYKYLQSMESNYIWEKYNATLRKIVDLKDASKFGMVYFTSKWYYWEIQNIDISILLRFFTSEL